MAIAERIKGEFMFYSMIDNYTVNNHEISEFVFAKEIKVTLLEEVQENANDCTSINKE